MAKKNWETEFNKLEISSCGSLLYPIIETHCHLDYLKNIELDQLVQKCLDIGIEKIISISVDPDHFDLVQSISEKYANVYFTQGVHPHEAKKFNREINDKIRSSINHQKIVAVGEIGLDYHYTYSPRDRQIFAFESQLEIACDSDLPVVIHTREADEDTIAILKNFEKNLKRKGVLHSYTSGTKLANYALKQNFYLGFNGIITFKNAANVREILTMTPLNQLLIETDSPFLCPIPFRGNQNSPLYLPFIAQFIVGQLNIEIGELMSRLYKNSIDLFFTKKK